MKNMVLVTVFCFVFGGITITNTLAVDDKDPKVTWKQKAMIWYAHLAERMRSDEDLTLEELPMYYSLGILNCTFNVPPTPPDANEIPSPQDLCGEAYYEPLFFSLNFFNLK